MKIAKFIVWGILVALCNGLPVSAQQQLKRPPAAKEALELLTRDTRLPEPDLTVRIKINQHKGTFELNDFRLPPSTTGLDPIQVDYPASHLLVPINTTMNFYLTAEDKLYEITAPELGIKLSAVPGRLAEVVLSISKSGHYEISCRENCAPANDNVYLNIHAVDETTYWTWYKNYRANKN